MLICKFLDPYILLLPSSMVGRNLIPKVASAFFLDILLALKDINSLTFPQAPPLFLMMFNLMNPFCHFIPPLIPTLHILIILTLCSLNLYLIFLTSFNPQTNPASPPASSSYSLPAVTNTSPPPLNSFPPIQPAPQPPSIPPLRRQTREKRAPQYFLDFHCQQASLLVPTQSLAKATSTTAGIACSLHNFLSYQHFTPFILCIFFLYFQFF